MISVVARRLGVAGLLLSLALVTACSKSGGNPTSPPGGGGGGSTKELNSGNVGSGQTYSHTFSNAGSYPYHCSIHPVMRATVTVDPASPIATASVSIVNATASGFSPSNVTIGPGGQVTWTNNAGQVHTVTSD